ncbi:hypothetical protein SM11_chr3670 [Sinorhizobium meliloti SM11]|uniref:Uncharacterized protein n=1 Tax=Sinorhizobium meliloti (strain SM11) TaxID=707241 RepID=F7X3W2_SINMM|nr:hypothetical protein SM11_chr3670 [Sinorhizobium meliloti SM11]
MISRGFIGLWPVLKPAGLQGAASISLEMRRGFLPCTVLPSGVPRERRAGKPLRSARYGRAAP